MRLVTAAAFLFFLQLDFWMYKDGIEPMIDTWVCRASIMPDCSLTGSPSVRIVAP